MGSEWVSTSSPAVEDERLCQRGVFRSAALENAFRRQQFADEAAQARLCVLLGGAGGPLFSFGDYWFFGTDPQFFVLLGVRTAYIAFCALVWAGLRRCSKPAAADRWLLVWCLGTIVCVLYSFGTRPTSYTGHAIVSAVLILLIYSAIPLPLVRQIGAALCLSVGYLALAIWIHLTTGALTGIPAVGACVMSNTLGAMTSWRLQRRRREVFLAARRETELRVSLEQALAEVRTLRGLLRICAWCKRIHNEQAVWQQLEEYVSEHTHADFTHGICPDCLSNQEAAVD